jgi:kynurenine formamidase
MSRTAEIAPTVEAYDATAERVKNWGRWGDDDQLGTLNLITPTAVTAAADLVARGAVFSLALPFGPDGPQQHGGARFNPIRLMTRDGGDELTGAAARDFFNPAGDNRLVGVADDVVIMPLQCGTHWDALSHCMYRGRMYNGLSADLVSSRGAMRNDISAASGTFVARGVLLDVAGARGLRWLEPGTEITCELLDECVSAEDVQVESGDVLLVRTGEMTRARTEGSWADYVDMGVPHSGLSIDTAEWLHEKGVAAVASDTFALEVCPCSLPWPGVHIPLHVLTLVYMGLPLGEMFDLDALAADCAEDGRYEFQFVGPPLPFTHAVASPLNPIAVK